MREEDAFLTGNHGHMTAVEMSRYVNHPVSSVRDRLQRLALVAVPNWTEEEDEFLRSHASRMQYSSIASVLGRSTRGVARRAARLGLGPPLVRWTDDEVEQLRREYGTRPTAEIARDLRRTVRAVERKAEKLDLAFAARLSAEAEELLWGMRDQPDVESFFACQFGISEASVSAALDRMRERGGPRVEVKAPIPV